MAGGSREDLSEVKVEVTGAVNDEPIMCLSLREGVDVHRFGTSLSGIELEWLKL